MSEFVGNICSFCNCSFQSRNRLFKHLPVCPSNKGNIIHNSIDVSLLDVIDSSISQDAFIYVMGGRVRGKTLGSVEKYNIKENTWSLCRPMLENRGSHCAVSVDSKLFVLGGGGFHSNLSDCEVYDPMTNNWNKISPMQSCRHALSATVVDGKIYAIGGWENGSTCCSTVEYYDVANDSWSFCAPLPTARRLLGVTACQGLIYVFGGNRDDPHWYTNTAEVYDTQRDSWRTLRNMPVSGGAAAATVGSLILIFVHGQSVWRYDPVSDSYTKRSPLPLPEWFCFDVVVAGSTVFVLGGATVGKWSTAAFRYDPVSDVWTELSPMLKARRRCAAALVYVSQSSSSSSDFSSSSSPDAVASASAAATHTIGTAIAVGDDVTAEVLSSSGNDGSGGMSSSGYQKSPGLSDTTSVVAVVEPYPASEVEVDHDDDDEGDDDDDDVIVRSSLSVGKRKCVHDFER